MTVKELEETTSSHVATLEEHVTAINANTATLNSHTVLLNELSTSIQTIINKLDQQSLPQNQNFPNPQVPNRKNNQIQGRPIRLNFPRYEGEEPASWVF